ncbi:hypothetical protein [Kitasatospora sp. NPDC059571]|uniref:hypothetical protein n=1 Tax=Kitasatospora sp. NPDC059571 TaxID=3346871 RepID=UPI00367C174B
MGEMVAAAAALLGDGPLRSLWALRAERRLRAGRPARVPCAVRSGPGGPPEGYTAGSLLFTPGAPAAAFAPRGLPALRIAVGGSFEDPDPAACHDRDLVAAAYRPPDGGDEVYLRVHGRYVAAVGLGLRRL